MKKHYDFSKELGDILVFSFCEGIKGYQKIMTNYEVHKKELDNERIGNYGIHFHLRNDELILVITFSSIRQKLSDALHNCFDQSKTIITEKSYIKGLISPTLFTQTINEKAASKLSDYLLNGRNKNTQYSYTLFIGYSFDRFHHSLKEQIKVDMEECITCLKSILQINPKIASKEINIYLVPFNNAEEDSQRILKEILSLP